MVEYVEKFSPELEVTALRQSELALQRKIQLPHGESPQRVASQVSLPSGRDTEGG
jgi:hypothetical protein